MPGPGPGRRGSLRQPAHADPGGGPERRAESAREGRGSGPAGTAQVRWEQGQVPGGRRGCGQGARCALAPEMPGARAEVLLGLQTFPNPVLHRHSWILPYAGLLLAPVMLCFLHAVSQAHPLYVLAYPGSRVGQGRCGGPATFLRALGLFFLCCAAGFGAHVGTGWKSPLGAEKPGEASCPFYFGACAAAT